MPDEVEHLWRHFRLLSPRRQAGMAANPLTHLELEAYCRLRLVRVSVWEVDVLFRVDDAVQGVWADEAKKRSNGQADNEIPASDVKGIKAMFQGLKARKGGRT